jgi:hypothetical protein
MNCQDKRGYRTEKAAKHELRKMRRNVVDWSRLNAYYCETHRRWHIGNRQFSSQSRRVLTSASLVALLALVGCADVNPAAPSAQPAAVTCERVDDQGHCVFTVKEQPVPLPEPCSTGTVPTPGIEAPLASCLPRH